MRRKENVKHFFKSINIKHEQIVYNTKICIEKSHHTTQHDKD